MTSDDLELPMMTSDDHWQDDSRQGPLPCMQVLTAAPRPSFHSSLGDYSSVSASSRMARCELDGA